MENLYPLLERVSKVLGKLNGICKTIPSIELFGVHVRQEGGGDIELD